MLCYNYKMREEGYRYPIVASSDAHQTVDDKRFLKLWTITFAKGSKEQKKLIDLLENEVKKYSRDFFKSPTK